MAGGETWRTMVSSMPVLVLKFGSGRYVTNASAFIRAVTVQDLGRNFVEKSR